MKKNLLLAAVMFLAGAGSAFAKILTNVPMQGGMVMPMVSYDQEGGHVHVMMPGTVPQLTPLLVSAPTNSFHPADPWFAALDPSAEGASFSKRYGFVMAGMTDPLPENTAFWIRKLSGPADLKFYRDFASEPKAFEPIYGTGGSPDARYWNGDMFHPVVAAPPGTNRYTATFEIYLMNTNTMQEVPDSSSGPLGFNWTNVSDGRPALSLARKVVVAWPDNTATNWVLESAATVNAASWDVVTNAPVTVDGQPSVILNQNAEKQYFRMRFVP